MISQGFYLEIMEHGADNRVIYSEDVLIQVVIIPTTLLTFDSGNSPICLISTLSLSSDIYLLFFKIS